MTRLAQAAIAVALALAGCGPLGGSDNAHSDGGAAPGGDGVGVACGVDATTEPWQTADAEGIGASDAPSADQETWPALAPIPPSLGRTWYVDGANPAASDEGPGTAETPLKSIAAAAGRVSAGETVLVRAGTYREIVHVVASGTPAARITFRAEGRVAIDAENQRSWCLVIGRNSPARDAGHFVTIDGFTCKNTRGAGFGGDALSAPILIQGTHGVVVRNCEVFRDDYPGYPLAFVPKAFSTHGIVVTGHNVDTLVEFCTAHRLANGGIGARLSEGKVGGFPLRPVFRCNHVSWINVDDDALQNYAGGMGFGNGTRHGLAEYNLVHHCGDFGIGTDDSAGHVIRYNVAYRMNHAGSKGGGGDGIKVKPGFNRDEGDLIHHNVSFLNHGPGFNVNVLPDGVGAQVYHNLAWRNGKRGITCTGNLTGRAAARIFNNVSAGNGGQDVRYDGAAPGTLDYNFAGDARFDPRVSPHTLGGPLPLAAGELLALDPNGVGASDVLDRLNSPPDRLADSLDRLNDPRAFSGAAEAIAFARERVRLLFTPPASSPVIDAGVRCPVFARDFLGRAPFDAPGRPGTIDLGPIEHHP